MKPHPLVLFTVVLTGVGLLRGATTELAIVAAMKLPEAPNYSWITDVTDDARTYTIDGKTDQNDYSVVNMPMVASVRRRSGRGSASSDAPMTAVFKGDEKLVIQTDDGWKKPDELPNSRYGGRSGRYGRGGYGGYSGGGWGGPGRRGRWGAESDGQNRPAYSNLQLTLSRPHEEVAILIANYTEFKAEGDVMAGTLSETGAKLLLVHPGQKEITPLKASGTFRLWVKDGILLKYETKLEGTIAVTIRGERREIEVHQTATTELKNVGSTIVEIPDEAKKKLGA